MNDQEAINRFVFMRSQGWSFNRIVVELKISKPTLIKWSRQYKLEIDNLRAIETEALAERVFGERHKRWEALARQLQKIEEEIESRDLEEIPASRLHGIAGQLRAEIKREMTGIEFAEYSDTVPDQERFRGRHTWNP